MHSVEWRFYRCSWVILTTQNYSCFSLPEVGCKVLWSVCLSVRLIVFRLSLCLHITTRSSAIADLPFNTLCQLKSCQLLHSSIKITFEMSRTRLMTLKVTQGRENWCYLIGHILLPISVCSNNTSVVHHFREYYL